MRRIRVRRTYKKQMHLFVQTVPPAFAKVRKLVVDQRPLIDGDYNSQSIYNPLAQWVEQRHGVPCVRGSSPVRITGRAGGERRIENDPLQIDAITME